MDEPARLFMESRFGRDFCRVRVHTDERAAGSAKAVEALAFTVGHDVVFGSGQYNPGTAEGRRLLAHELTHVVQQSVSVRNVSPGPRPDWNAAGASAEVVGPPSSRSTRERVVSSLLASPRVARQTKGQGASGEGTKTQSGAGCTPPKGIPNTDCSAYGANSWWLPPAYVNNATCACKATPNEPSADCVRKFLQDRLASTPTSLKTAATGAKLVGGLAYEAFVQTALTPRIYQDHVDAYKSCCCPSGPAPYASWIGVTTVPIPSCSLIGHFINKYGSCHGTPGAW